MLSHQTIASVLLSKSESAARARPLNAWTTQQRNAVEKVYVQLSVDWQIAWGLLGHKTDDAYGNSLSGIQVNAVQGYVGAGESYRSSGVAAATISSICWAFVKNGCVLPAAIQPNCSAKDALQLALFGGDEPRMEASLAAEIANAAWCDWWLRVGTKLGISELRATEDPVQWPAPRAWSETLYVTLPWWQGRLNLCLERSHVMRLLEDAQLPHLQKAGLKPPDTAPLASIRQALAEQTLRLHVELAGIQLDLGQLQDLRVGDVIPLTHKLDSPLHVRDAAEQILCAGWLGQMNGQFALELTRSTKIS